MAVADAALELESVHVRLQSGNHLLRGAGIDLSSGPGNTAARNHRAANFHRPHLYGLHFRHFFFHPQPGDFALAGFCGSGGGPRGHAGAQHSLHRIFRRAVCGHAGSDHFTDQCQLRRHERLAPHFLYEPVPFYQPLFDAVHPKYRTPTRTIFIFSAIGIVQILLAFLFGQDTALEILGNMYAFGATLGYSLVFIALIRLRFTDPYTPRPYKMPLNFKVRHRQREIDVPVLGFIGTAGVLFVLTEVVLTHTIGRIAGPCWVLLCFIYYVWYRKKIGLPVFRTIKRDWETEQKAVLQSAEEFELLEHYRLALAERDKLMKKQPQPEALKGKDRRV